MYRPSAALLQTFTIDLPNSHAAVGDLGAWLADISQQLSYPPDLTFHLDLVLAEAFTNIVDYAFPNGQLEVISLTINTYTQYIDAIFVDNGEPFNPFDDFTVKIPDTLKDAGFGGLGIHLITSYTSHREYKRDNGKNIMLLRLEDETAQPKEHTEKDYAIFLKHRMFDGLDLETMKPVFDECTVQWLEPREILLTPGEQNHHLYFLLSGGILIFLDEIDSGNHFTIEAGDCIGEMSIIQERRTSAYVVAREKSHLLVIHETVFWEKMGAIPNIMRNMLTMLSKRMRKQSNVTREIFEKQLRYELLQKEVTAAGKLQTNIVPQDNPLFSEHPQVEAYALMESAREVGGDFYDAFTVSENHVCVAIGDVSGKGLPAALFMVRAITLLRMGLRKKKHFKTVMSTVNRMLIKNNPDCNFVTLFVGLLNIKNGRLQYYNGGHNPPYISQNGRGYDPLPLPKGVLLGFAEKAQYEMREIRLTAGDTIVLYTDGITEAENGDQAFFGEKRTQQVLDSLPSNSNVSTVINTLNTAVAEFVQDTPQSDDITMLAMRYLGT